MACLSLSAADTPSLEKRVSMLESEIAALKVENRKLKETAIDFLSAQLVQKEREHARFVYRTQILPAVKVFIDDFGSKAPKLPKEEEINTLADAYRPMLEMFTQLMTVAGGK